MFDFRIINLANGSQIVDRRLKTSSESLTPIEMMEYMEIDSQLSFMDRMERKARAEAEYKRKLAKNPLYRIACICGLFN